MNEKFNKLITILLLFSFFLFNVFRILPVVSTVSADEIEIDDSTIFGTLINASQGGRGGKGLKTGNRALGDSLTRDNRGGGQRLGGGPQRGDRYGFNPSAVDINLLYNDYTTFINNYFASDDDYIVNLNKTFSYYMSSTGGTTTGFYINSPRSVGVRNNFDMITIPKDYSYVYIISEQDKIYHHYIYNSTNQNWSRRSVNSSNGWNKHSLTRDGNYFMPYSVTQSYISWHVNYLVFSNYAYLSNNSIDIIHRKDNMPTKQEFINNYTNTFNVEYDTTTNQLVQNDTIISYNINDFSDDSITINNEYITNNFEIHIGDNIENDFEQKDYTTILERILDAINDLPTKIAELMPEPIYKAGTNIWDFLTDSLDNILDFLETLLMGILNLIFPNAEQLEESKGLLDNLFSTFSEKTEFITAPIQSFSSIYGSSRVMMFSRNASTSNNSTNLYNRTIVINDTELHILPASLEPAISAFRMVSTGVVVILTIISIYTRFRGVVKN